jgi:hypothetical protein
MLDQQALERIPCGSPHISTRIDGIVDLVYEAFDHLGLTVTTSSVALTTQVFHYLITKAPDHPAVQNMTDTLEQSVLSVVLNRSTASMTQLAKQHKITKQAFSKRVMGVTDRLGLPVRSQKSQKAREAYDLRARKHHDKRRRETPKFNSAALMKGIKCKH